MPDLQPCGTDTAYRRHHRRGEPVDEACRAAHAARCAANYVARQRAPREVAPCGTPAAVRRHYRHHEPLDYACQQAQVLAKGGDPWDSSHGGGLIDPRPIRNGLPFRPYVYRGRGHDIYEEEAC